MNIPTLLYANGLLNARKHRLVFGCVVKSTVGGNQNAARWQFYHPSGTGGWQSIPRANFGELG